ncbi:helix-turn-helix domain-containing protein [Streptomyces achromogenes]|uniref:helix-turn-helix domain-containing protein n=1 Tax=Streptomyces achromogenes TaxID=67255 RepID=UPI0033DCD935
MHQISDQSDGEPPSRKGRPPGPICDTVGVTHRTWLEQVRRRLAASGLTLDDLVSRSGYSKTRLSELLRGKGYYPGWAMTYSVVKVLDIPPWPLRRLWTAAAREAEKKDTWIADGIHAVPTLGPEEPPIAHRAFKQAMGRPYTAYAQAFLQTEARAHRVVAETFDILWLTWNEATRSSNTPRHAWNLLRAKVMERAETHDGYPDLRAAALRTTAVAQAADPDECLARTAQMVSFFEAVSRLPDDQMDVTVLRFLCHVDKDAVPGIIGLPPAITHSLTRHARGALHGLYPGQHPDTLE